MDLKHLLDFTRQKLDGLNLNVRTDHSRKARGIEQELNQQFNNLVLSKCASEDPRYSNLDVNENGQNFQSLLDGTFQDLIENGVEKDLLDFMMPQEGSSIMSFRLLSDVFSDRGSDAQCEVEEDLKLPGRKAAQK